MLNPNCLVRNHQPIKSSRRSEEYGVTKTTKGWKIQYQGYEVEWVLLLTSRAYKAWKAGDLVFDPLWGTPNPYWDKEIKILFKEYNEDN